jgi:AraC-like DNA-binding protein
MRYREHHLALDGARDQALDSGRDLHSFVECVWFLSAAPGGEDGATATTQRILPDGCAELIFHFRDRFHVITPSGWQPQPAAFLVGLLTSPLILAPATAVDTMAVRFRPGGAHPFFDVPLSEVTDRSVRLDELWTPRDAARLWRQLAATQGDELRVAIVVNELRRRLARVDDDRVTSAAIGALVQSAGQARIDAIADRSGTTVRQLQRRFADQVGVSPKVLARILRFQRTLLLRDVGGAARTDWVRVALECGYADQSHLIHDYASFAGETPATLLAAEGELSAYFTAPQRLASLFGRPFCTTRCRKKH